MSHIELLQVVALTALLTIALLLAATQLWKKLHAWLDRLLPPRYLRPRNAPGRTSTGDRRRASS